MVDKTGGFAGISTGGGLFISKSFFVITSEISVVFVLLGTTGASIGLELPPPKISGVISSGLPAKISSNKAVLARRFPIGLSGNAPSNLGEYF